MLCVYIYIYLSSCKFLNVLILLLSFSILIRSLKLDAETPAPTESKNLATWGTDVPDDLVLDQKKVAEALKKVKYWTHVFTF